MPLFEVDAQRPLLVQPDRSPAATAQGVGTTAHRVVDSHIDGLLGEQIFPVSPGAGPDEPHLLALDATGSPVVVELVADLDRAALTRALDHAGAAGRLTRGALAERYHGGPAAFHRDVSAFYDSVPITRSQPGRSSARLIVICQEASEEILNAVDFLRQPTMPVEVLKMGVVHSADGRRFVDVSPLVIHPASAPSAPSLSAPESARPGLGVPATDAVSSAPRPADARAADAPVGVDPETFAEGVAVGLALGGKMPAATQPARDHVDAAPPTRTRRRAARPRTAESGADAGLPSGPLPVPAGPPPAPDPAPAPAPAPHAEPDDLDTTLEHLPRPLASRRSAAAEVPEPPRRRSRSDRFTSHPEVDEPAPGRAGLGQAFAEVAAPAFDLPVPEPRWSGVEDDLPRLQVPPLDPPRLSAPPLDSLDDGWTPAPRDPGYDPLTSPVPPEPAHRPWAAPEPARQAWEPQEPVRQPWESPEPAPRPWEPVPGDDEVDEDLVALARTLVHPTTIVWSRPRRRQYFEAVLHQDGAIELADGSRYRHPDHAASAASGSPTADGWSVWRLGTDGPTLLDAYRHRFA
ncbi:MULTISPECIES: restriction system modified-DNA reader domain-containing protein [unclassified Isoptericola]|uniref:restriction system modified-DNA reader domain-containing protein n=1 Tax=unclassified Isoptericola TaxID=2623355 RepID=UPI003648F1BE